MALKSRPTPETDELKMELGDQVIWKGWGLGRKDTWILKAASHRSLREDV